MTLFVKTISFKMENLGETIRKLREDKNQPLRTVAAFLNIDQAILSKIERGQRKASRKQVLDLAEYFNVKSNSLLLSWLSDKLIKEIENEDIGLEALKLAGQKIKFLNKKK